MSVTRDLIEYCGIEDPIGLNTSSFSQINIENEFYLPCPKPDIDQIIKVKTTANVKNTKVIKTPKGTSLEGLRLTGYKLIIEGELLHRVQYSGECENHSIYSINCIVPFISFVVLPEDFCATTYVTASVLIEDIYASKVDCRSMYINATILLNANVC